MTAGLRRRWADYGAPPRIVGLDVARALAVVGMIGAHVGIVGDPETRDIVWSEPGTWGGLVNGRSSILFAVLAGISVALLSGGSTPPTGQELSRTRLRLVGRGLAVLGIGLLLELLGTPVVVILTFYGVLFMAAPIFVTWRPRTLFLTAGILAVVGPPVYQLIRALTLDAAGPGTQLLLTYYPLPVWLVFLLVGLGLGRLDIRRRDVAAAMALIGAGLALAAYTVGALAETFVLSEPVVGSGSAPETYGGRLAEVDPWQRVLTGALSDNPHSGGTPEILGSGGFVLAVIGVCLLVAPRLRLVLVPVAALGAMPLSAYSAQIVAISVAQGGPGGTAETGNALWAWMVVGLLIACTVWALTLGRGPLERLVARAGTALAGPSERSVVHPARDEGLPDAVRGPQRPHDDRGGERA